MLSILMGLALAEPTERPDWWPEGVRSEMVDTGSIDLEVYRAGETGFPVVFMQDMHNYFDTRQLWDDPAEQAAWIEDTAAHRDFVARLGKTFRVLAPIRRGYGKTTDPGTGYDIAAHGEDVVAMLEKVGIERAIFVGRTPSQNSMLWLAEHHPEVMAGMVLLEGSPQPFIDIRDPDAFAFASGWWRGARDMGDSDERIDQLTIGRFSGYVPHFLTDPSARIAVPTLYLGGPPAFEGKWMWSNLYSFERQSDCPEVTDEYPCSVFGNPERVARLDAFFADHPMTALVAGARDKMAVQFEDFTVSAYPHGDAMVDDWWGDYYDRSLPFMMRIAAEAGAN